VVKPLASADACGVFDGQDDAIVKEDLLLRVDGRQRRGGNGRRASGEQG
jgi:hypothetical protein